MPTKIKEVQKTIIVISAISGMFIVFILLISGYVGILDRIIEQWNIPDVSMGFSMAISNPDSEIRSLKNFFSDRIKKNLSDDDFDLLHDNFSESESWQEFFQKVPERNFNLLPVEELNDVRLKGVTVNLLLIPSATGWKIDGLKSIRTR